MNPTLNRKKNLDSNEGKNAYKLCYSISEESH